MPQGFGQFCPIALASEVLTQRWTLLILRELMAGILGDQLVEAFV
jgi:DNA-binding HxlR family transcriptional regulator